MTGTNQPGDVDMMSEQAALMIEQAAEHYENKLREFIEKRGDIFLIDDAIEFLEIDQDHDATRYAIPAIHQALKKLGCKTEKLIVYIPPSNPANTNLCR